MFKHTLVDLNELLLRIPDQLDRDYFAEAVRCYHIGAYRAAILLAWVVTAQNLKKKLEQLAREDGEAHKQWDNMQKKENENQSYEEQLIDVFKKLDIFSASETTELKHFRDTRNWCAHPTGYEPTAEKVRYCLRLAVELALARPLLRGFAYIRSLAQEQIKHQFFFPYRDESKINEYVRSILQQIRTDAHPRLVTELLATYRDSQATTQTKDNIRLFLASMFRQASPAQVSPILQRLQPLLEHDLQAACLIIGVRSDSLAHLNSLNRDRVIHFVLEQITTDRKPDQQMVSVLETIVQSQAVDQRQRQEIADRLSPSIYDIYPQLEDRANPYFLEVLLDKLENDLARVDGGQGTDYIKANPAGRFLQNIGLSSFDPLDEDKRQRLANALVVAACENAYDVKVFFTNPQRLDDRWLYLLLDGLAHHFLRNGTCRDSDVVIKPLREWVYRGNDLTDAWNQLILQNIPEQANSAPKTHLYLDEQISPKNTLIQTLTDVADILASNHYDASRDMVLQLIDFLRLPLTRRWEGS